MSWWRLNPNLECTKIFWKIKNLREYPDIKVKLCTMKDQPDCNKVDYVFDILKKHNLLPDAKDFEETKCDSKSVEFRKEGNSYFSTNPPKYVEALRMYNKSLCFAISKDNQSIALANRSAVFFKMQMFQECLESIRLAREVGIPKSLEEKLIIRTALCVVELEKEPPNEFLAPKISMPVNKKMPFLAKCLEFGKDKKYGRHVITKKDISAGKIIAIKEPFSKICRNSQYMKCISCLAEVPHLLMPCDTCTQTMFCSNECKEKAYKDFHVIECPISGSLYKIFDGIFQLAFRMTVKAFLAFPDTETMVVTLEKIDREQKNVFSYDWSEKLSLEDLYAPIRTLLVKTSEKEDYGLYFWACLAFNLLKNNCPVFSQRYLTSTNADNVLKNLLYRHLQQTAANSFTCAVMVDNPDSSDIEPTICGLYSLLNHSCIPNVAPFPVGSSYGIAAIKNIAAGEQIFTNYGYGHERMDKAYRQEQLFRVHHFHCKCQACVEDFPLFEELPKPGGIPEIMEFTVFIGALQFEAYSLDFIRYALRLVVPFIKKFSRRYPFPIRQICEAERILFICLLFLCQKTPMIIREKALHRLQDSQDED